jgi:glycosyltransferase involved in cell wall biosynthesis
MRVLVYYHDGLLPMNQHIRRAFEENSAISDLLFLASRPTKVDPAYSAGAQAPSSVAADLRCTAIDSYRFAPHVGRLWSWIPHLRTFRPEVIVLLEEPISPNVIVAGIANWITGTRAPILTYAFENVWGPMGWSEFVDDPKPRSAALLVGRLMRRLLEAAALPLRRRFVGGALYSYSECADLVRAICSAPLVQQWWAIDWAKFRPEGPRFDAAQIGLGGKFLLGYVGRFTREKGILDLIGAVASLGPNFGLVLIGDGSFRSEIERRITKFELGARVRIIPPKPPDELAMFYRGLDLLVLPSRTVARWKEQYGRVLMEAMRCGTLVLGSDSGAIPSVIGNSDYIFPEGNVLTLVDRIRTISEGRASFLDLAARVAGTSADDFAGAYVRLANQALERRRAGHQEPPLRIPERTRGADNDWQQMTCAYL